MSEEQAIADGGKDFEELIDALWEAVKAVL